jgi:hypothetical protein
MRDWPIALGTSRSAPSRRSSNSTTSPFAIAWRWAHSFGSETLSVDVPTFCTLRDSTDMIFGP